MLGIGLTMNSTTEEAKEYFGNLEKHRIKFNWSPQSSQLIQMAFGKENSSLRKDWINQFKVFIYSFPNINTITGEYICRSFSERTLCL